jgi:uncharacterized protein
MEYLIIDGHNIINAWPDIFDLRHDSLEECRGKLLHMLSNYQGYKKTKVMVVFDAHMVKGSQLKEENFDHIQVVFTRENETADHYIERFVYKMSSVYRIRVATSDYLEQTMVLSGGGARMTPRELKEELLSAEKSMKEKLNPRLEKLNTITTNADPLVIEKLEKMRRSKF